MRDIFEVLDALKKEFIDQINCGEEIENAEEFAMDSLTVEEMEEYDAAVAQALRALEAKLQIV